MPGTGLTQLCRWEASGKALLGCSVQLLSPSILKMSSKEPVPALELRKIWQKEKGMWKVGRWSGSCSLEPGSCWHPRNPSRNLTCGQAQSVACELHEEPGLLRSCWCWGPRYHRSVSGRIHRQKSIHVPAMAI